MAKAIVALLRFYRAAISVFLGSCCRFHPSCSRYAEEAIVKKGVFRGSLLSLQRLLKCQPFSAGGFDPVD